jgi:hypothetical protein
MVNMKITRKQLRRIIREAVSQEPEYDMQNLYSKVLRPALDAAEVDMWSYGDVFRAAAKIFDEEVTDMMSRGQ